MYKHSAHVQKKVAFYNNKPSKKYSSRDAIPLGSKFVVCLPRVESGTCGARTGRVGARCTTRPCPATPSRASTPGSYSRAHQPTSRIRYGTTPQVERPGKG